MPRRRNIYSDSGLDRADHLRSDDDWLAARLAAPETRFVPVWRGRSLFDGVVTEDAQWRRPEVVPQPRLLRGDEAHALVERGGELVFLGLDEAEVAYVALDLSALEEPDHEPALAGRGHFADLRNIGPLLEHREGAVLAYARALIHWHQRHKFCGICGTATESRHGGHQRRCGNADCGASHFPRTDPAVIMLVHDGGERCVLGRQKIWPPGMHSTLAGFVEPGESLEDAVAREVREEVGIEVAVSDVAYHSSQPWPFPSSLMLGFYARCEHRPLRVHPQELEDARWYSRDELRASPEDESFRLPRKDSIARRLIEDWLAD